MAQRSEIYQALDTRTHFSLIPKKGWDVHINAECLSRMPRSYPVMINHLSPLTFFFVVVVLFFLSHSTYSEEAYMDRNQ